MTSVLEWWRVVLLVAGTLALTGESRPACGQAQPSHLAEMPAVERVKADVQGSDRLDTLARQKAAFEQLSRAVEVAAASRFKLAPAEQRWRDAYRGAADATRKEAYSGLSKSSLQQWNALTGEYERDEKGRDALLRRYFARNHAALSAAFARDEASRAPQSDFVRKYGPQTRSVGLLARAIFWLVLAVMVLAVVREFLPKGISPRDPLKLRTGLRSRRLEWFTGRVAGFAEHTERTGHSPGTVFQDIFGNRTVYVGPGPRETSRIMFSLVAEDGRRHVVSLVNSSVSLADGSLVTAVWAAGKGVPMHVLFFDRTNSKAWPVNRELAGLIGVSRLMYLPVLAVAVILGSAIAAVGGFGMSETMGALMGVFLGAIAAGALFLFMTTRRVRRFMRQDAPRILAAIDGKPGP